MKSFRMQTISYIDSHTGGEPTRTVVSGGPELGVGSLPERLQRLQQDHDWLRQAVILEPRGCDWLVGALLLEPTDPDCLAAVIFFNNAGYLGMCGHGLIGVVATLAHLGRCRAGASRFETPAGVVSVELHDDGAVSIDNVVSYRHRRDVVLETPGEGSIQGDIAYGGNWFFLVNQERVDPVDLPELHQRARRIRRALLDQGICGRDGAEIDHIEFFGPPSDPARADSRSFVLCPGGEYDRSPCGTGTSAKLACLAADGKLSAGSVWRQESIVGSVFEAAYRPTKGGVIPTIKGRAYITAEVNCLLDAADPFRHGIDIK